MSLVRNASFLIVKNSCVREELIDLPFFLQTQLQQITVQEHLFGEFALAPLTFELCTSPTDTFTFTYHPFNLLSMYAVDNLQRLIFVNGRSLDKFTGTRVKCKSLFTFIFTLQDHLRGQWHSPISRKVFTCGRLTTQSSPHCCSTRRTNFRN